MKYQLSLYLTVFPGEIADSFPEDLWTLAISSSMLEYSTDTPIVGPPFRVS